MLSDLSDLSDFVRFVRVSGLDLSDLSDLPISAIKKKRETDGPMDGRTDRWTDGPTDRPSYRDAWTHLKTVLLFSFSRNRKSQFIHAITISKKKAMPLAEKSKNLSRKKKNFNKSFLGIMLQNQGHS